MSHHPEKTLSPIKTIHIRRSNDRDDIPPYFWYVTLEEGGRETTLDPGPIRPNAKSFMTTKQNAEDMVVKYGENVGVRDTNDANEWAKRGYLIEIHEPHPDTFKNWPE